MDQFNFYSNVFAYIFLLKKKKN